MEEEKQSVISTHFFPYTDLWLIESTTLVEKTGGVSTERSLVKTDDVTNLLTQDLQTLWKYPKAARDSALRGGRALRLPRSNSAEPPLRGAVETLQLKTHLRLADSLMRELLLRPLEQQVLPPRRPSFNRNISSCRERLPTESWEFGDTSCPESGGHSGARLQAVRQLEEALLIVDDVQEVDVGSRLRAALLADAVPCTTQKSGSRPRALCSGSCQA